MKYCPYCGADFADGAASFCMECGKSLPTSEDGQKKPKEKPIKSQKRMEKKRKHPSPKPRKKHEKPVGEHVGGAFHPKDDGYDGYRALTQCVLTPAKPQGVRAILSARQKELLLWLTEAGLRLTTAELVFLTEHHVAPQINLLGDRNRQNLTETIYTQETILITFWKPKWNTPQCGMRSFPHCSGYYDDTEQRRAASWIRRAARRKRLCDTTLE